MLIMRYKELLIEYINYDPKKLAQRLNKDSTIFNGNEDPWGVLSDEEALLELAKNFPKYLERYDPTQKKKYVNWMLVRYMKGDIRRFEDIPTRIAPALELYDRLARKKKLKPEHKDINQIKDLESVVEQYKEEDVSTKKENIKQIEQEMYKKGDAKLIYDSNEYKIVIPKTHKASCFFGRNTRWCTTMSNQSRYHEQYTEQGPLYIILHKPTNERWQFHFQSNQFMDEEDDDIELEEFASEHTEAMQALVQKAGTHLASDIYIIGNKVFRKNGEPTHPVALLHEDIPRETIVNFVNRIIVNEGIEEPEFIDQGPYGKFVLHKYNDLDHLLEDMIRLSVDYALIKDHLYPDFDNFPVTDSVEDFIENILPTSAIEKLENYAIREIKKSVEGNDEAMMKLRQQVKEDVSLIELLNDWMNEANDTIEIILLGIQHGYEAGTAKHALDIVVDAILDFTVQYHDGYFIMESREHPMDSKYYFVLELNDMLEVINQESILDEVSYEGDWYIGQSLISSDNRIGQTKLEDLAIEFDDEAAVKYIIDTL